MNPTLNEPLELSMILGLVLILTKIYYVLYCCHETLFVYTSATGPSDYITRLRCEKLLENISVALESKDFNQAVTLATECIQLIEKTGLTNDYKLEAYYLRAEAKYQLKQYQDALTDVSSCIVCQPRVLKGLILLAKILVGKEEYEKAFRFCIFLIITHEMSHDNLMTLVKLAVSIASKVTNGFEELLTLPDIDNSIWNDVIIGVSREGAWSSVKIILFGTDDISGIDMNIDARGVKLSGLIEYCQVSQWMQWGQKLALFLLKHGANYKTICPLSKLPLHVALEVGLKTDSFDLLRELISKYVKPAEINETDQNGNTLLHKACSHESSAVRSVAINLLLNHNIDVTVKNKSGNTAYELLPDGHPDRDTIEEKIKNKGKPSADVNDEDKSGKPSANVNDEDKSGKPSANVNDEDKSDFIISRQWSKARVQKWLADCMITQCGKKFRNIDGAKLHELCILQDRCPDVFYGILEKSLQLDLVEILKTSAALRHWKSE